MTENLKKQIVDVGIYISTRLQTRLYLQAAIDNIDEEITNILYELRKEMRNPRNINL